MNNLKTILSMIKYEFIKLYRNKLLFIFLLVFPVVMILTIASIKFDYRAGTGASSPTSTSSTSETTEEYYATLFVNGELQDDSDVLEMVNSFYSANKIKIVQTYEEGEQQLRIGDVYFFIYIDVTQSPVKAVFYYDKSSIASSSIISNLRAEQIKLTYNSFIDFLGSYGITLNEDYFDLVDFKSFQTQDITFQQKMLPVATSFVAVIIMFGLSYSMARDNETNIIKQISYTPISTKRYLFTKSAPFILLGSVQALVLLLLGVWVYGVEYQINMFIILLLYILFVIANVGIGLVFSCLKNQTTSTFATMIAVLLPVIAVSMAIMKQYPTMVQIVLNLFPLTPFMQLFSFATFNGVVLVNLIMILLAQIVVYFGLAYVLTKQKAGN